MEHLNSPEGFQAWKDSPATQEFLGLLGQRQRDLMAAWGRGASLTPEQQAQAVLLGQLSRIRFREEGRSEGEQPAASIEDLAGLTFAEGDEDGQA